MANQSTSRPVRDLAKGMVTGYGPLGVGAMLGAQKGMEMGGAVGGLVGAGVGMAAGKGAQLAARAADDALAAPAGQRAAKIAEWITDYGAQSTRQQVTDALVNEIYNEQPTVRR